MLFIHVNSIKIPGRFPAYLESIQGQLGIGYGPDLKAERENLESMHVKSIADALPNEGHLPCSDRFTATRPGSPWEQIPCSTGTLRLSC